MPTPDETTLVERIKLSAVDAIQGLVGDICRRGWAAFLDSWTHDQVERLNTYLAALGLSDVPIRLEIQQSSRPLPCCGSLLFYEGESQHGAKSEPEAVTIRFRGISGSVQQKHTVQAAYYRSEPWLSNPFPCDDSHCRIVETLSQWKRFLESLDTSKLGKPSEPQQINREFEGYASAADLEFDHGIRPTRLSEAATAETVRTKPAPRGYCDKQGKRAEVLYHVQDALGFCEPKHVKNTTRKRILGS